MDGWRDEPVGVMKPENAVPVDWTVEVHPENNAPAGALFSSRSREKSFEPCVARRLAPGGEWTQFRKTPLLQLVV